MIQYSISDYRKKGGLWAEEKRLPKNQQHGLSLFI